MTTIETVTDSGEEQAVESEAAQPTEPPSALTRTAVAAGGHDAAQQRTVTLLATVFGAVVTALIGGMFLFIVSALGNVRDDIGSLRSEMQGEIGLLRSDTNARFADVDRRFDQIHGVLLDHTDRLARIETTLDISGRPLTNATDTLADR